MTVFGRLVSKIRWRQRSYRGPRTSVHGLKRLVILGSGWGGYSLLMNIDKTIFQTTVVSPRNHFLFTPLLASTTVGEFFLLRAIVHEHARVALRKFGNGDHRSQHIFQPRINVRPHLGTCTASMYGSVFMAIDLAVEKERCMCLLP